MLRVPSIFLGLVMSLALANPSTAYAQKPQREVERLHTAATDHTYGCYGEKKDTACAAFVAGLDAAMAASDATNSDRHSLLKRKLYVMGVRGANLLEAGQPANALKVLRAGEALMLEHLDGGAHMHTLIDNIRLQKALVLTHLTLGNGPQANAVVARVREAADWAVRQRTKFAAHSDPQQRQYTNALGLGAIAESEDFEREIAEWFVTKADDASSHAQARPYREQALTHLRWALNWTDLAGTEGAATVFDSHPVNRLAEVREMEGGQLSQLGRKGEAAAAYLNGASLSCTLYDALVAKHGSGDGLKNVTDLERVVSQRNCENLKRKWYYVAPETAAQREAAVRAWIKEQLRPPTPEELKIMQAMANVQARMRNQ